MSTMEIGDEVFQLALSVIGAVYKCDASDLIYYPAGSFISSFGYEVICRKCYLDDVFCRTKPNQVMSDSEPPGAPVVHMDQRGRITDNALYPPRWLQIYAGKCEYCGAITFALGGLRKGK